MARADVGSATVAAAESGANLRCSRREAAPHPARPEQRDRHDRSRSRDSGGSDLEQSTILSDKSGEQVSGGAPVGRVLRSTRSDVGCSADAMTNEHDGGSFSGGVAVEAPCSSSRSSSAVQSLLPACDELVQMEEVSVVDEMDAAEAAARQRANAPTEADTAAHEAGGDSSDTAHANGSLQRRLYMAVQEAGADGRALRVASVLGRRHPPHSPLLPHLPHRGV